LFTDNTRAALLNTPHNPTGKVFTVDELTAIGAIIKKHNSVLVTNEVYERIVFDGHKHIYAASLPGMWEHTITVGSAGKTFGTTGWKLGWVVGPSKYIAEVINVSQWVQCE
jgi:aspartate/methionine/tyrosine aminotransferase